jgi:hypothetical protein
MRWVEALFNPNRMKINKKINKKISLFFLKNNRDSYKEKDYGH